MLTIGLDFNIDILILILILIFFVWNPDSWNRDEGQITNEEQHRDRRSLTSSKPWTSLTQLTQLSPNWYLDRRPDPHYKNNPSKISPSHPGLYCHSDLRRGEITKNISISIPFWTMPHLPKFFAVTSGPRKLWLLWDNNDCFGPNNKVSRCIKQGEHLKLASLSQHFAFLG